MSKTEIQVRLSGQLLDDEIQLTLAELCQACRMNAETVLDMVEYGIVEPLGSRPGEEWRFTGVSVQRVRSAQRLQADLGVNIAGAALAIDLLEELEVLRARLGDPER